MVGKTKRGRPSLMQERRAALVAAAYRCAVRDGFEGLRLRAVAGEAGLDHSTLHHYFATKDELVAAVVSHATARFRSTTPEEGTPVERLRAHLTTLSDRIEQEPDLHRLLRELDVVATRSPAVRAAVDDHERGWRASLVGLLTGLASARRSSVLEPAAGAELVVAAVKGASLRPSTASTVLGQLADLLLAESFGTGVVDE